MSPSGGAPRPSPAVERVLVRLSDAKRSGSDWRARCPAHDDREPSLSVAQGERGALLKCHAGCPQDAVVSALGLSAAELFDDHAERAERRQTVYPVRDPAGRVVAEHVRTDLPDGRKGFTWRRRGRPGLGGLKVAELPLYGWPLAAGEPDGPVILTEGEKACDAVKGLGFAALGTVTGAGSTSSAAVLEPLRGRHVVLWPDNDDPGRQHMDRVAERLRGVAASVRRLSWPGAREPGDDAADFIARGGGRDELAAMIEQGATPSSDARPGPAESPRSAYVLVANVERGRVQWLWPGRIPRGKLVILDGDPGLGKSTVMCDVAARLTRGQPMPMEAAAVGPPAAVVLLSAEDDVGDTLRPRLEAAGADVGRVVALDMSNVASAGTAFPRDVTGLRRMIIEHGAVLVVVDPLMAFLSLDVNSWRDQDVRRALFPLAALAQETGAAIVVVRHLNKAQGSNAVYRGGGSIGIIGAARVGLLVAKHPNDEARRVLAVTKCNLGPPAPALAFRLAAADDVARVEWEGPTEHSAADLLDAAAQAPARGSGARGEAETFLRELLEKRPLPASAVMAQAREAGISAMTLRRAQRSLGIRPRKDGLRGGWVWALPSTDTGAEDDHPTPEGAQSKA